MILKNLFCIVLFSFYGAAAMEMRFQVKKNCSEEEKRAYYEELECYLNTGRGKSVFLYPPRGIIKFPSYDTYFLHLAIALDDASMVRSLLENHGKRIVAGPTHGSRTLLYALRNRNEEIIELIRKLGSNIIMLPNGKGAILEKRVNKKQINELVVSLSLDDNDEANDNFNDVFIWN